MACIGGAIGGAVFDSLVNALSGRKITLSGIGRSALIGCVGGLVGFGLGNAIRFAQRLHQAAKAAREARELAGRARDVHKVLDKVAQTRRTTAAAKTAEGNRVVGSGGRDLTPAQRRILGPGESPARLPGQHAERTVLDAILEAVKPRVQWVRAAHSVRVARISLRGVVALSQVRQRQSGLCHEEIIDGVYLR